MINVRPCLVPLLPSKVDLCRCPVVQRLVETFVVVEAEKLPQPRPRLLDGLDFLQVDIFILDRSPEPFHKNVVQRPPAPVHADPDPLVQQRLREARGGELRTLVHVEYLTLPRFQYFRHCLNAEVRIQRGAQRPAEHIAAVPVDHRHQVHKPPRQPDIGDVGAPHLVTAVNGQPPQQIGVDLVFRVRLARAGLLVHGLQPHRPQQTPDPLGVDFMPQAPQVGRHPQHAIAGRPRVLLVQQAHQGKVFSAFSRRAVVQAGPVQAQQRALLPEAERPVHRIGQRLSDP